MTTGDYHGLDYNKDWHCVEGQIPEGKYRILLKLHYLIVPEGSSEFAPFVRWINVAWTKISRETMRMSAEPETIFEEFVAFLVNISRLIFNNFYISLCILIFFVLGIGAFFTLRK